MLFVFLLKEQKKFALTYYVGRWLITIILFSISKNRSTETFTLVKYEIGTYVGILLQIFQLIIEQEKLKLCRLPDVLMPSFQNPEIPHV